MGLGEAEGTCAPRVSHRLWARGPSWIGVVFCLRGSYLPERFPITSLIHTQVPFQPPWGTWSCLTSPGLPWSRWLGPKQPTAEGGGGAVLQTCRPQATGWKEGPRAGEAGARVGGVQGGGLGEEGQDQKPG